jgi:hypothetical protein
MNRPFPIEAAELLQFQLLGHRFPVLGRRIVPAFALGALKRDDFPSCACHRYLQASGASPDASSISPGALDAI